MSNTITFRNIQKSILIKFLIGSTIVLGLFALGSMVEMNQIIGILEAMGVDAIPKGLPHGLGAASTVAEVNALLASAAGVTAPAWVGPAILAAGSAGA